jgi:hypothetical protein
MLKKLLVTTAIGGLMISSAVAQSSSSSPSASGASSTPPAASSTGDSMKSDANRTSGSARSGSATSASVATIPSQKPDQILASKVKGADVIGQNDEKIGDVSDILFSKDGKIEAYILSVGGFLGVGAKEVALAPSSIQMTQDKDDWKLKVNMTKDQLAQAPNFERQKDQRSTTGAASSGSSTGSTSADAPRKAPAGGMAPNAGNANPSGSNQPAKSQ